MRRTWRLLTHRGRFFILGGAAVVVGSMAAGIVTVMTPSALLVAIPV